MRQEVTAGEVGSEGSKQGVVVEGRVQILSDGAQIGIVVSDGFNRCNTVHCQIRL